MIQTIIVFLFAITVILYYVYSEFINPSPKILPKDLLLERLKEIESGRCPRCDALLFVRHLPPYRYLACENQYDRDNTLMLYGSGDCYRMITSLDILECSAKHHGIEMPIL